MTIAYLFTWLMIFLRGTGIVVLLPQMAGRSAPILVRMGLAAFMATLLAGVVPRASLPGGYADLALAAAGEVALGLALGFVGQLAFGAVDFAGRVISSEIGLSNAPGLPSPDGASDGVTSFLAAFAVVLFFLFGAHLTVISAFARSFALAAPGRPMFNPGAGEQVAAATAHLIETGLRMAAPFIALNFLITLAFAVLGRVVPRMGVFILSASIRSLGGLALFGGAGALIARYLFAEFNDVPLRMLLLLPAAR